MFELLHGWQEWPPSFKHPAAPESTLSNRVTLARAAPSICECHRQIKIQLDYGTKLFGRVGTFTMVRRHTGKGEEDDTLVVELIRDHLKRIDRTLRMPLTSAKKSTCLPSFGVIGLKR